jgi:PRC-barrel domain/Domain of unknown function (DUF2382)
MPTPSVETVRGWLGRVMVDRDGKRLGEITDIYLDRETERPEWAVVHTGLFGLRSTFVPLAEATEVDNHIQVPHQRTQVKDAPNIEADGQLSEAEEAQLYRHYGLDYDTVTADSDAAPSHPRHQDADARSSSAPTTSSAPTSTDEQAVPPEGSAERRVSGGLAAADAAGAARPPAEDEDGVDEGVSRPFVYETPRPPQDYPAGSRRRQPGQVRLRRYLVTEVVTETETGQRHELRVEREPIDNTEVAGVATPSGQPVEPADPAPAAGPDSNDWFQPEGDPPR